jgi:putative peptidoglycan lipid II flippase
MARTGYAAKRPTQPYAVARASAELTVLSIVSPAAGLLVEMALAARFGTSAAMDGFRGAMVIIDLGATIFMGTLFPNAAVPLLAEFAVRGHEKEGRHAIVSTAAVLVLPTTLIALAIFLFPVPLIDALLPGLGHSARTWAILFARWFGIALLPMLVSGTAISLLYDHRIFWTPALGQTLNRLIILGMILLFAARIGAGVLVFAVLTGWLAYVLLQIGKLITVEGIDRETLAIHVHHPGVRRLFRLGLPMVWMACGNLVGGLVINWSLSKRPVGTIAAYGYAYRTLRLAELLPSVMLSVLFPSFAESWQVGSQRRLRPLSTRALRMALFLTIPLTGLVFAMRLPIVALFFHRGAFSQRATIDVTNLLGLLLPMVPSGVASLYLVKILYAVQEVWWPNYIQFVVIALEIILIPSIGSRLGAPGVAATMSAIWAVGAGLQFLVLWIKYRSVAPLELLVFACKLLPAAALAAKIAEWIALSLGPRLAPGAAASIVTIVMGSGMALVIFAGVSWMLEIPEMAQCVGYLRWESEPLARWLGQHCLADKHSMRS